MSKTQRDSDIGYVAALAELLQRHDLCEIDFSRTFTSESSMTVRIARQSAIPQPSRLPPSEVPRTAPPPAEDSDIGESVAQDQHPGTVTSPMVGTVYLQPEPGAPPFVAAGEHVSEGQTLLIIEAMKTMNNIPSPATGTVKRILVENGSPVEYGAPLVIIE